MPREETNIVKLSSPKSRKYRFLMISFTIVLACGFLFSLEALIKPTRAELGPALSDPNRLIDNSNVNPPVKTETIDLMASDDNTSNNIIYVDDSASSGGNGNSWSSAYNNLNTAIDNSISGDEIWVAEGKYIPGSNITDYFVMKGGVPVYGGFQGLPGSESDFSVRDWETYITVLSGDIDGNDLTDSNGIVTDTANIIGENSYHVVVGSNLDGFVITAGHARGGDFDKRDGGGLYQSGGTLRNLLIIGNLASQYGFNKGGGLYTENSPTLINVTFFGNRADNGGGGMYSEIFSDPSLNLVTFEGNSADAGGGLYNRGDLDLNHVTFTNNTAGAGGGFYNSDGNPSLIRVTFSENSASSGGGMYNWKSSPSSIRLSLSDVTFINNIATEMGGGLFNFNDDLALSNVKFIGNLAIDNTFSGDGGGLWTDHPLNIINGLFVGNYAANNGGALFTVGATTATNVTFANNDAGGSGGGVYNQGSAVTLQNNILWGNTAVSSGSQAYRITLVADSLIQDGCPIAATCTGSTLVNDPRFVLNPNPGDGDWTTTEDNDYGNLHLDTISPAIEAGNNNLDPDPTISPPDTILDIVHDLDNKSRVINYDGDALTRVDLGPYETQYPNSIHLPIIESECKPLYFDDFSNSNSGWPVSDDGNILYEYKGGKYRILVRDEFWWAGAQPILYFSNLRLSVITQNITNVDGVFGLIFGISEDWSQFYAFVIHSVFGEYRLEKRTGSNWAWLTSGESDEIMSGTQENRLTIVRDGNYIEAYVNDTLLASVYDSAYAGDRAVGVIVSSSEDPLDIRFDDFLVESIGCAGGTRTSVSPPDFRQNVFPPDLEFEIFNEPRKK